MASTWPEQEAFPAILEHLYAEDPALVSLAPVGVPGGSEAGGRRAAFGVAAGRRRLRVRPPGEGCGRGYGGADAPRRSAAQRTGWAMVQALVRGRTAVMPWPPNRRVRSGLSELSTDPSRSSPAPSHGAPDVPTPERGGQVQIATSSRRVKRL